MTQTFRVVFAALLALAVTAAATVAVFAGDSTEQAPPKSPSRTRIDPATVRLFADVPVLDGGRVKPISTLAGFTLLALNGKRTITTPADETLQPTEWLMDVLFFPDVAIHYPCFVVESSEALDAAGIAHDGKSRRDRYSYADLMAGRGRIAELEGQYQHVEAKSRTAAQTQLVNLGQNLRQFELIASTVSDAVQGPTTASSKSLTQLFPDGRQATLGLVLERAEQLRAILKSPDGAHGSSDEEADPLLTWLEDLLRGSRGLALIPPGGTHEENPEWYVPTGLAGAVFVGRSPATDEIASLRALESMFSARDDAPAFAEAAARYRANVVARAEARGEYGRIPLEVSFYRADYFYNALAVFLLAFVLTAASWMKDWKWFTRGAVLANVVALGLLVAGITIRCIIRGRPPVSTLYETILFTSAVAVICSLAIEYVNRRGIALAMASFMGAGGMFLAHRYEVQEGIDTMPSLVAVLDTNFWLATHVTTVTIGYSAGLLAGALGHVYLFGRIFGLKRGDTGFYKALTSMTYGTLAFGLVFSVVGTILGGIWANDSWGRFWGWDPKENGALVIVLWELAILHGRLAGHLRDFGIAMASVFGAVVVAASWWGVNLLGVGLHSYGFTAGIGFWLMVYFAIEAAVLGAGFTWYATTGGAKPATSAPLADATL